MNEKGSIVWRILFGVVMASLLIGILIAYTSTQKEYTTGGEAQTLADSLSETAFSAIEGQQQTFQLYKAVGKSNYELDIENNTFIVRILGDKQEGREYRSTVGVELKIRDNLPEPGKTLYLRGTGEKVIVSSESITLSKEELKEPENYEAPEFYTFSKQNPKTSTGIIASYFYAKKNFSTDNLDIKGFRWKSSKLEVRVIGGKNYLTTLEVQGEKNNDNVGYIDNLWIVTNVTTADNKIQNYNHSPSIEEAYRKGWLFSPEQAKETVKGRTWKRTSDNKTIEISQTIDEKASAATTNISTYPTWRFEISKGNQMYIFHLAAMPWEYSEEDPGFAFESEPEMVAER